MNWLNAIVFSNIYISLAAGLMMAQTCQVLGISQSPLPYLSFFSSMVLYNFHRLYRFRFNRRLHENRYQWGINHRTLLIILSCVGVFGTVFFVKTLSANAWIFLVVLSLVSFAYVVEFIGKNKRALRDLPGTKIFIVAMVWAAYMVYLPVVQHEINISVHLIFIEKMLFIFSITIPFDIRDMSFDKASQKTLPQILGVNKSVYLGLITILTTLLGATILYLQAIYSFNYLMGQLLSYLFAGILILLSKKKRNELFYSFLLDGTIIVSALLGILLS